MKLCICLSASTTSPGNKLSNMPVLSKVDIRNSSTPRQPFEINATKPWGVITMRYLTILCFLEFDYVCALTSSDVGLSIKTSKQSIIIVLFLKFFLKSIGIAFCSSSLSGHLINTAHFTASTSSHLLKYRDTVDLCTPNL